MRSADIIDQASEQAEAALEAALAAARTIAANYPTLRAKGFCHYCDEPVGAKEKFCDEHCRDDYDYLQARSRANGR
jgi:hypothetical protein